MPDRVRSRTADGERLPESVEWGPFRRPSRRGIERVSDRGKESPPGRSATAPIEPGAWQQTGTWCLRIRCASQQEPPRAYGRGEKFGFILPERRRSGNRAGHLPVRNPGSCSRRADLTKQEQAKLLMSADLIFDIMFCNPHFLNLLDLSKNSSEKTSNLRFVVCHN